MTREEAHNRACDLFGASAFVAEGGKKSVGYWQPVPSGGEKPIVLGKGATWEQAFHAAMLKANEGA